MNRTYVGEFNSQKIIETFDGPKSYVQVYKEETQDGTNYVAITKDNQKYSLKQTGDNSFTMSIGEDTYNVYPEEGDNPDL